MVRFEKIEIDVKLHHKYMFYGPLYFTRAYQVILTYIFSFLFDVVHTGKIVLILATMCMIRFMYDIFFSITKIENDDVYLILLFYVCGILSNYENIIMVFFLIIFRF